MKKLKILALALTLALSVCFAGLSLNGASADESDFDCAYSAHDTLADDSNLYSFGATEVISYTEQEAIDAGIPTGFEGSVISVKGAANKGVLLDFSAKNIEQSTIASITFRVFVGDDGTDNTSYPEIRIPTPGAPNVFTLRYNVSDKEDTWIEIVLSEKINELCTDGYLNKFELAVRSNGNADAPFYIDSVKVKLFEKDFDCAYSAHAQDHDGSNLYYFGAKELTVYNSQEATDAGIPAGFSGRVVSVVGYTDKGILLDFSAEKYPQFLIKAITFRVYVGDDGTDNTSYPEVRIPKPGVINAWTLQYNVSDKEGQWIDVEFDMSKLNDVCLDGYLNKFELGVRSKGTAAPFYIDSVKVTLKENDFVAPTINYVGEDSLTVAYKQTLSFNVTATDTIDGEVAVEQIWGDPSRIDGEGNPLPGTHTLTFKAVDLHGNVAQKTITVTVEEADLVAPTIDLNVTTIYAKVGTTPRISVTASDDSGNVSLTYTWTEGALDSKGRLCKEGSFVLTITATDSSNNVTEKTITFIVSANGDSSDVIVDEEELCPGDSVEESEEDSEESSEEASEEISEEESSEIVEESSEEEEESSAPITSEKTSEATPEEPSSAGSTEEEGGCMGSLGATPIMLVLALIGGALIKKRS